jgi:hypothetical protein
MDPRQKQFSLNCAASESNFLPLPRLGFGVIVLLVLGAGHASSVNLIPVDFKVKNISVAGPATLDEDDSWQTYTVSFDVERLNGDVNVIVWLKDKDSQEFGRGDDDNLSFKRVTIAANQTHKEATLKLIGFQMKVWGTATQGPNGDSNDRDSGEGGPSLFGSDPAEIYAGIAGFKSGVKNVTVRH